MIGLGGDESRNALMRQACCVLSVMGWVVIVASAVIGVLTYDSVSYRGFPGELKESAAWAMVYAGRFVSPLMMGIAAIIAAQFIRYAFGELDDPPILLKYGDKILLLDALVGCVPSIGSILLNTMMHRGESYPLLISAGWSSLLIISRVALLVALAVALRKILPVIREVKGLV